MDDFRGAAGFHDDQTHARRRSLLFLAGSVGVLVAIVNVLAFLGGAHYRSCDYDAECSSGAAFRWDTFGITMAIVAVYLVLAYALSARAALALARAHEAEGDHLRRLRPLMEQVCIAAGQPMPKLMVIEDDDLNAFAAGITPKAATVAVTTGMMRRLSDRELRGVLAHEMSHIRNRDMSLSTVCVTVVGTLVFLAAVSMMIATALGHASARSMGRGRDKDNSGAAAAAIAIIAGLFALLVYVLALPAASLLRAALSRKRETLADATAVEITRDPYGLRSALEKLEIAEGSVSTNPAIAHLWINAPVLGARGEKPSMLDRLMSTHPPLAERIAVLRQYEGLDPQGRGPNDKV